MRILSWLVRAFIFFTLFAFALNNQHEASVHWFFGVEWRAPIVFVVLAAFAAGCALGAAAMLPGWWRGRSWDSGGSPARSPSAAGQAAAPGTEAAGAPNPARGASNIAAVSTTRAAQAPPASRSAAGSDSTSGLGV